MKNLKINYENVKKSLKAISLSIVLTTVSAVGLTGCSKKEEYKSNYSSTVYSVPKTGYSLEEERGRLFCGYMATRWKTVDSEYSQFDRILYPGKSNKKEAFNYAYVDDVMEFVYPAKTINCKSDILESDKTKELKDDNKSYEWLSTAGCRSYGKFILPNSIKWAENKFGCGKYTSKTNEIIEMEDMYGEYGNRYLNYKYIVVATDDIYNSRLNDFKYYEKYGQQNLINKDDYIMYEALFKVEDNMDLTLIADKQTGIGSEDENVKEQLVGNYDEVMIPITAPDEKSESETLEDLFKLGDEDFKEKVKEKIKNDK